MKQKVIGQKGFTLIELLIVMLIVLIMAGISMASLLNSQRQQVFSNTFGKIQSLFSNARSLAITGKGQLDFTDFDNDKCNFQGAMPPSGTCLSPDYVTPANYGIRLDSSASASENVILFADINPPATGATGQKNRYDAGGNFSTGDDLRLDGLKLPTDMSLVIKDTGGVQTNGSVFYSPNYADINFEGLTVNPFIFVQLKDSQLGTLCSQIKIHKLAGIPEIGPCE